MTSTPSALSQAVPHTGTGARFWISRAGYGLLLGAVIAALEFSYYYPLVAERDGISAGSLFSLLLVWGVECMLFALIVGIAEPSVSPGDVGAVQLSLAVAVAAVVAALLGHAIAHFVLRDQLGIRLFVDQVG